MIQRRICILLFFACIQLVQAQLVMKTGGTKMPDEWIDQDTGHKVVKLVRNGRINMSFYFHNNPFVGNKMVFCSGIPQGKAANIPAKEIYNMGVDNSQMYWVDLSSLKIEQLTNEPKSVRSEIICAQTKELFYQIGDTVFAKNMETQKKRLIFVFPDTRRASIATVNVDGSLLAGIFYNPKEAEILKKYPHKSQFFDRIYNAKLARTMFVIDTKKCSLKSIYTENAWLNHIQFSPVYPHLLMFCHEGPWHKVDRIWTIDVTKKDAPQLMHKRSMDMEIAGHEWFGSEGQYLYFDLQKPRGKRFFVGRVNIRTLEETDYELQRNEWSVHYTTSWGEKMLAGDGGDSSSVAKASDGKWIYLYKLVGNQLKSIKLVNMKKHTYNLEPNVHFSPDNKWVIFRANFEGEENIYAVQL